MNSHQSETDPFSDILKYREKYKGQWIIIKYGGALAANNELVHNIGVQCAFLKTAIGAKIIVVHGGGEQTSRALKDQGIVPAFDAATGRRLTDEITLKIFDETLRELNKKNVQTMQEASQEAYFQGMAGYDLDAVTAKSIGDFTGKVVQTNTRFFKHMQDNCIPVFYTACKNISPKISEHRLNVNADEFAGFLGQRLKATYGSKDIRSFNICWIMFDKPIDHRVGKNFATVLQGTTSNFTRTPLFNILHNRRNPGCLNILNGYISDFGEHIHL